MKPDARLGTLEEVRARYGDATRPIFERLRAVLDEIDPQSTETYSPREKAIYVTLGRGKMTDGYCYLMDQGGRYVNLGFFRGAELNEPALEGTGKLLRHVKVRSPEQAESQETRRLITVARDHMLELKGRP